MENIIAEILGQCWAIFVEAAPFVLFGFFAAGVLRALLPEEAVARHLGGQGAGPVLKASLVGIPLPLCSCAAVPAAIGLRRQGASKGAAAAFLVSVPETGIDSIAITYALLDPLMTVVRPFAALLTATVTGLLINRLPAGRSGEGVEEAEGSACGCAGEAAARAGSRAPLARRLRESLGYAFGDMLGDIGRWLLLGIGIAGVIAYALPADFLHRYLHAGPLSLLAMLLVGIPLYICASASTPIAAALVLKGLSPGAALVFLLAGPATNVATLTVVGRYFGRAATGIYLFSIAACSLLLGWLTDRLYAWSGLQVSHWLVGSGAAAHSPWMMAAAVLLLLLLVRCYLPRRGGAGCGCQAGGESGGS